MRISGFEWDEGNVVHLALGHGIEADEREGAGAGDHRVGHEQRGTTVLSAAAKGMSMPPRPSRVQEDLPKYYDRRGVLQEIEKRPVEFALDEELRQAILKGHGCGASRTFPSSWTPRRSMPFGRSRR